MSLLVLYAEMDTPVDLPLQLPLGGTVRVIYGTLESQILDIAGVVTDNRYSGVVAESNRYGGTVG